MTWWHLLLRRFGEGTIRWLSGARDRAYASRPILWASSCDLGADVVKIEPREGDIARRVSPRSSGPHNEYFLSLNRNKRSVVLDLASLEGRRSLRDLASTAHGLVTNLRPSAIRKLGLTYEALKDVNPKLVCVALTGFGLEGRDAARG